MLKATVKGALWGLVALAYVVVTVGLPMLGGAALFGEVGLIVGEVVGLALFFGGAVGAAIHDANNFGKKKKRLDSLLGL